MGHTRRGQSLLESFFFIGDGAHSGPHNFRLKGMWPKGKKKKKKKKPNKWVSTFCLPESTKIETPFRVSFARIERKGGKEKKEKEKEDKERRRRKKRERERRIRKEEEKEERKGGGEEECNNNMRWLQYSRRQRRWRWLVQQQAAAAGSQGTSQGTEVSRL